ncbi:MAG TPA: gamma-glutamyl-gamma-aminobutyrate hydrolase family protein [Candidatus Dormibacteraeota bacterium]|nr:gamma-glutamyl-gamma-aminobutyrate hydrolase family protein [Candidatus Dormibacteraeota bacterium]
MPKIGITCSPRRGADYYTRYLRLIEAAGGRPLVIEPMLAPDELHAAALMGTLDGLVLPGGWDIDPPMYGEKRTIPETEDVDHPLDSTERQLVRSAVRAGVPVFGICRGLQMVNVALGGTLRQHIDKHDTHDEGRDVLCHEIVIEPGSELMGAFGSSPVMVNSLHHQAVKRVAPSLRVTAKSTDGIVEGVESAYRMVVAVQCHPEELLDAQPWALSLLQRFMDRARSAASARLHAMRAPASS